MRRWLNHPWTLTLVGAVFAAALTEVTPLKLFSGHIAPRLWVVMAYLNKSVQVPRWMIIACPLIGAALAFTIGYIINLISARRAKLIFEGLRWELTPQDKQSIWPICDQCKTRLQPQTQAEQRMDKNDLPFLFTPPYANILFCSSCKKSLPLQRPWNDMLQDAQSYFASRSAKMMTRGSS